MKNKIARQSITDLTLGKLSPEESLKLLEAIEQDPSASQELEFASEMLNFTRAHGKETFEPMKSSIARDALVNRTIAERLEGYLGQTRAARWATGFVALCVVICGLVVVSSLTADKYYPLASIEGFEIESTVRGPGQEDLTTAQNLYRQGDLEGALRLLERYIRAFPHGEMIDYVHYSAGAICLLSSSHSFLSLFPSYDRERVLRGLGFLEIAANVSTNPRLVEDARWLRAKAFLMLHRPADAIEELRRIELLNGVKGEQASRLITEIQKRESRD